MFKISGFVEINQSCKQGIGYVSQEAWIQNCTIRENILFGKKYDPEFYSKIIDSCELTHDFQLLSNGDQTVIGSHGSTLSGGQKSRIALARALYQNFDIYLIDEPFASVDKTIGQQIYQKCFRNILSDKTVILVTNHIEYLQDAFVVYYMDHGTITHSILSTDLYQNLIGADSKDFPEEQIRKQNEEIFEQENNNEEERERGTVKLDVYSTYLTSIGYFLFFMIVLFICLMQISKSASDVWLSIWTRDKQNSNTLTYLYVFISIGIVNSIITLIRAFLFAYGGIKAAIKIHKILLNSLFKSSLLFFDIISFGIIINRFSSDLFNVDDALPFTLNIFLAQLSSLIFSLIITTYGMPWILVIFALLFIIYYFIQVFLFPFLFCLII